MSRPQPRPQSIRSRLARRFGADPALPIDPDIGRTEERAPRRIARRLRLDVLAVIALGGALGTLGRYEADLASPDRAGQFPTTTLAVNTSGAFLLGILVTVVEERLRPGRYLRPFLGVGVLGGWTTMSTLAVGADRLLGTGRVATGLAYLAVTLLAGALVTALGIALVRRVPARRNGVVAEAAPARR